MCESALNWCQFFVVRSNVECLNISSILYLGAIKPKEQYTRAILKYFTYSHPEQIKISLMTSTGKLLLPPLVRERV